MSDKRKILFIINPISGVGKKNIIPPLIEEHIPSDQFETEIAYTQHRGHGKELAKQEAKNFDAIVAVGGDGSMNEIGSSLVNTNCALGIIPTGSGNGLARHLNIPLKLDKAIQRIAAFEKRTMDVGQVNNDYFFATCGFGFDAHIARRFDEYHKRGFLSYIKLVISEYGQYQPKSFFIQVGEQALENDFIMLSVANATQFGNNFIVSPHSVVDDGKLEIVMIKRFKMRSSLPVIRRFFNGTIDRSDYFDELSLTSKASIRISGEESVDYHLDGEPKKGNSIFEVSVLKNALHVI